LECENFVQNYEFMLLVYLRVYLVNSQSHLVIFLVAMQFINAMMVNS